MRGFWHSFDSDEHVVKGLSARLEDRELAALLGTLRAHALTSELSSEPRSVDEIARMCRSSAAGPQTAGSVKLKRRARVGMVAAVAAASLAITSGLAYAGDLPAAAQSTAAHALARVGVSVPAANGHAKTHPDSHGGPASHSSSNGHGKAVSTLAHTTTATGRDKGATISTLASGGKSHAANPPGKTHPTPHGGGNPNPGKSGTSGSGVTTGSTASSGHNGHGATTSIAASNGHSSAGSANAGTHPHQKPYTGHP
jgi:hypothetical protein